MRRGNEQKSETKTFLKGIRVFNIGASTSAQDSKKKGSASGIVGVLVTERQSEKIVWAKKNGEIRLALIGDNVASDDFEDPDFPMDDEQEEDREETRSPLPQFEFIANAAPKFDKSKLKQVKVYSNGKVNISYFDEDGNQVEIPSASDRMGPPMGMPPMPGGARGLPPVDYEGFDGSAELPNGIEEDQYRGE
jgi:hypothetical protein